MTHDPLTIAEFQRRSQRTDHFPEPNDEGGDPLLGPLLGLAGEVGTLLAAYKKRLRDGAAYELFKDNVAEELGDILWYLANAAEKAGLSLDEVARSNLAKTSDRWPARGDKSPRDRKTSEHFDFEQPRQHQLPRTFEVTIHPVPSDGPEPQVEVIWRNRRVADRLGDNTYDDSGYRYHDAFHLANAAVLGWSPVARKIFGPQASKGNKELMPSRMVVVQSWSKRPSLHSCLSTPASTTTSRTCSASTTTRSELFGSSRPSLRFHSAICGKSRKPYSKGSTHGGNYEQMRAVCCGATLPPERLTYSPLPQL